MTHDLLALSGQLVRNLNRPPKPMLFTTDGDHDVILMQFVERTTGSVPPNTVPKIPIETIDPGPDCFSANDDASLDQ